MLNPRHNLLLSGVSAILTGVEGQLTAVKICISWWLMTLTALSRARLPSPSALLKSPVCCPVSACTLMARFSTYRFNLSLLRQVNKYMLFTFL